MAKVHRVDTLFISRASASIAALPSAQVARVQRVHPKGMWSMQAQRSAFIADLPSWQVVHAQRVHPKGMYSVAALCKHRNGELCIIGVIEITRLDGRLWSGIGKVGYGIRQMENESVFVCIFSIKWDYKESIIWTGLKMGILLKKKR